MIVFNCTSCGQKISVKEELAGKKGKCTHCKQLMTVPAATASTFAPTSGKEPAPSPAAGSPKDSVAALVRALRDVGLLEQAQKDELARDLQPRFTDPKLLAKELIQRGWLTPYQVNQIFQNRAQELLMGQYVLLERLGEGGMGTVFKARHRRLERVDALKVIRKDHLANADAVKRFHQEAKSAAKVSHPNIVTIYDASEARGTHFLAMEYVEGIDLAKLVKQNGPLPVEQACEYIRQAALGLQHAHERGLVHRDIKPANLFVNMKEGIVKVLDMGLARMLKASTDEDVSTGGLTQTGAVMGTPDYISPEQAMNSHKVDIRADIYSLGCSLYFLLAGQPPFLGGDTMSKLLKHQLEEPRKVEELRKEVPLAVAVVVRKMMAKKPEERYQTPAEAVRALQPFAASTSVTATLPSGGRQVSETFSASIPSATFAFDQNAQVPRAVPLSDESLITMGLAQRSRKAAVASRLAWWLLERSGRLALALARLVRSRWATKQRRIQLGVGVGLTLCFLAFLLFRPSSSQVRDPAKVPATSAGTYDDIAKQIEALEKQPGPPDRPEEWDPVLRGLTMNGPLRDKCRMIVRENLPRMRPYLKDAAQKGRLTSVMVDELRDLLSLQPKTWHVVGPFPNDNKDHVNLQEFSKKPDLQKNYSGVSVRVSWRQKAGERIDIASIYGPIVGSAYGYTEVFCVEEQEGTIVRSAADSVKVWLNGAEVGDVKAGFAENFPVHFQKGRNSLMVRVDNTDAPGWWFSLKVRRDSPEELLTYLVRPADEAWVKKVQELKPEQQVQEVAAELKELNPGFSGVLQSPVIELAGVVEVTVDTTQVRDIAPVRTLAQLHTLRCACGDTSSRGGNLVELAPLKGMSLKSLTIAGNPVKDLGPLQGMKLEHLDCNYTKVTILSPLHGMPLKSLHCYGTSVSSLEPLQGMPLKSLQCGATSVSSLEPLKDMKLTTLYCESTAVSDLTPLKDMPLTILQCRYTKVTDLAPLKGMPLKELYCEFDPKRDAAILRSIKTLETINAKPAGEVLK